MNLSKRVVDFFPIRDTLLADVGVLIGYGSSMDEETLIDERHSEWEISGDTLYIYWENDDEESYHCYTVSSYSMKGEQFFMGTEDGLTFVMAYPEDDRYDNTSIFVLDNEKQRT